MKISTFPLLSFLAAGALAAPVFAAPPVLDAMLSYSEGHGIYRGQLFAGPAAPAQNAAGIQKIFAMPSGQLLAIATAEVGPPPYPNRTTLNELRPDGSLRLIGEVPGHFTTPTATVLDMDLDQRGRFYMVIRYYPIDPYNSIVTRLHEIDPATGSSIRGVAIPDLDAVATAPDGLWALQGGVLLKIDPDTFQLGPQVAVLGVGASNLEADSAGRLYYLRGCAGPCLIGFYHPRGGGEPGTLPMTFYPNLSISAFTIDRRCYDSNTERCLQDGRFRAGIAYRAYDGAAGPATAAAARSRDTGIFSFFDPDNWELMVKVLDGCGINGHFWVYAAASTDVEYAMTVTDTQTGAQKVYSNPLGHVAETVTDGSAFPCSQ